MLEAAFEFFIFSSIDFRSSGSAHRINGFILCSISRVLGRVGRPQEVVGGAAAWSAHAARFGDAAGDWHVSGDRKL